MNGPREPRDDQVREIPIKFDNGISRPLVTTTGKVITWLSALLVIVVAATATIVSNRFETLLEAKFDRFELRLQSDYAKQKDLQLYLPRTEYDLRHSELIDKDKQQVGRIEDIERRLRDLEQNQLRSRNGR